MTIKVGFLVSDKFLLKNNCLSNLLNYGFNDTICRIIINDLNESFPMI